MGNKYALDKASSEAVVSSLGMILDYAIMEGAELRLPAFVYLLRMARLELQRRFEIETPPEFHGGG